MSKLLKGTVFCCSICDSTFPKWYGKCPSCSSWGSIPENGVERRIEKNTKALTAEGSTKKLSELLKKNLLFERLQFGIEQLDLVLGNGLVCGSIILISGDPGIGKSTLLIQAAASLSLRGRKVAYITAEESIEQVADRAARLGLAEARNLIIASTTSLEWILSFLQSENMDMVVLDSIQTIFSDQIDGSSGGMSQIKFCTSALIGIAKQKNSALMLVGHVTKDGMTAGPKSVEHMVDVVLTFEADNLGSFRILRSGKNRFGASWEVGIFEMLSTGLSSINDPAGIFVGDYLERVENVGGVAFVHLMGTKVVFLEVQALTVEIGGFIAPRRSVVGWDSSRLAMMLAIMTSKLGTNFSQREIYVNIAGGPKVLEPAADLACVVAIWSFYSGSKIGRKTVAFGEVGLAGEVRPINGADRRIKEAKKFGFDTVILPQKHYSDFSNETDGLKFIPIANISDLKKKNLF